MDEQAALGTGRDGEGLRSRPLYRQVRDRLVGRIASGAWAPGEALPSEGELAAGLGVSQGTVRKALDALADEKLVVRRQGRGTYVARHDDARILFQFFKLVPDGGERRFPDSQVVGMSIDPAGPAAAEVLGLDPGALAITVERVRSLAGRACIAERIVLPYARFAAIAGREALPNNLYELYATAFGVTIARASERLKAVAATGREARLLRVAVGTPLLAIDRTAYGLDQAPVEWRVSLCDTADLHYVSDLR